MLVFEKCSFHVTGRLRWWL